VTTTRVYASGASWYYVEDLPERNPRTGRPRQKWHRLSKLVEGEAAMHRALAEFLGKTPERGNMKLRLAEFQKAHFATLSFGVRKEYERMFEVIAEAFADFDDREVLPGDVIDFLNDNFAAKPTARGHYKARLSTFFSWCVLKGYIQVNPCREVKLKKPPKRKGRMGAAVYWAMKDALPESGQLFLELTYLSRQRPTEIRLLRESMIKPDRIRFEPTKTERSSGEYVEITRSQRINRILERLRELRAERQKHRKVVPIGEDPYLLISEDGEPFTKSGLNSLWKRARTKAGAGNVTTRDVRPYALAQMEAAGEPVEKIREAAAHTTTAQTEAYLNQHRERFSTAVLHEPPRPT
jgi:integrase